MANTAAWLKSHTPRSVRRRLRLAIAPAKRNVPGRRPVWGNLRRDRPFSASSGWDRGLPVDRFFIETFLGKNADRIRGDVLEILNADYTLRYGGKAARSHVLDIDESNSDATIFGDLCDPNTLPPAAYDCVILTQTLQYLSYPDVAIGNLYRSLRAGGTLLITAPCLAQMYQLTPEYDYWRFTPVGLRMLIERACPGANFEVGGGGNLTTALAVLLGCAVEDLSKDDFASHHPDFPVIAHALVIKTPT